MQDANELKAIINTFHDLYAGDNGIAAITTQSVRELQSHKTLYVRLHYFKLLARSNSLAAEMKQVLLSKKITICGKPIELFLEATKSRRGRQDPRQKLLESSFFDRIMLYPSEGLPRRPNPTERTFLAIKFHLENGLKFSWRTTTGELLGFHQYPAELYEIEDDIQLFLRFRYDAPNNDTLVFYHELLTGISIRPMFNQYNTLHEITFDPFDLSDEVTVSSLILPFQNHPYRLKHIENQIFLSANPSLTVKPKRNSEITMYDPGYKKGNITVLKKTDPPEGETYNGHYYECLCKCGEITVLRSRKITETDTPSCGCAFQAHNDLSGKVYGKLIVQNESKLKNRHWLWKSICECGNVTWPRAQHLTGGRTKSCGQC